MRLIRAVPLVLVLGAFLSSCSIKSKQTNQVATLPASPQNSTNFESHPNWLGLKMNLAPFEALRLQVEKKTGLHLKSRHEAHITVVTPPEWAILSQKLTGSEIEKIALSMQIQSGKPQALCVGQGQTQDQGQTLTTFFVLMKAPLLLEIRRRLQAVYAERQGKGDFQANHYLPHVTLGFTDRDLFEQDGVYKNEGSCIADWGPI